jgi:hypothetical protein
VSDENEIDNRRRLAERVSGLENDLYGFRGQPGRLADMEESVKLERAERIAAVKAVDTRVSDVDLRLRARELFDHELKVVVRTSSALASAIVTAVVFIVFVGLPKLVEWLQHLSK